MKSEFRNQIIECKDKKEATAIYNKKLKTFNKFSKLHKKAMFKQIFNCKSYNLHKKWFWRTLGNWYGVITSLCLISCICCIIAPFFGTHCFDNVHIRFLVSTIITGLILAVFTWIYDRPIRVKSLTKDEDRSLEIYEDIFDEFTLAVRNKGYFDYKDAYDETFKKL